MNITDIILLIIISLVIYHYISRNLVEGNQKGGKAVENGSQEKDTASGEKPGVVIPVINVIFQNDIEEEELVGEIADMYLEGRAFYYNGIQPPGKSEENEDTPYIKFADVNWEILKTVNV